jgi:isopentenyl phosphate kinase
MTTVLKLGGSVVTEKDEPESVDEASLAAAADAVVGSGGRELVVVHGGRTASRPRRARTTPRRSRTSTAR